jgi:hypothetical protein
MSSIIEGYNYDIFISYRQKDNKGDRWVSKFVEALKTELEATFKEDVSVYFDENPHDRLQETHKALYEGAKKAVAAISKCKPYIIETPIKAKMEYLDLDPALPEPKLITKEWIIPDAIHLFSK